MREGRGKDESPFKKLHKASNQLLYHHLTLTATPEAQIQCYRQKKSLSLGRNSSPRSFDKYKIETHLTTSQ